jgi:hypothetical protein
MADRDTAPRSGLVDRFIKHHDQLSIERQRRLASLQLFVNALLLVIYLIAIHVWGWRFNLTTGEKEAGWTVWIISLVLLIVASSFMMPILDVFQAGRSRPGGSADPEPTWLATYRKFVYYPAVLGNLAAIAVFIEQTGGLVRSPFAPVLFALILGAQQESRFKSNSRLYIIAGVVITVALVGFEKAFGTRSVPNPPSHLYFWIVAAVFLLTAILTHIDKAVNYKARGRFPEPSHIELYVDDGGIWRFALHSKGTRLDPVVELPSLHATLVEAEKKVDSLVAPLLFKWRDSLDRREALGFLNGVSRTEAPPTRQAPAADTGGAGGQLGSGGPAPAPGGP